MGERTIVAVKAAEGKRLAGCSATQKLYVVRETLLTAFHCLRILRSPVFQSPK